MHAKNRLNIHFVVYFISIEPPVQNLYLIFNSALFGPNFGNALRRLLGGPNVGVPSREEPSNGLTMLIHAALIFFLYSRLFAGQKGGYIFVFNCNY
jgi:hypothetical protein